MIKYRKQNLNIWSLLSFIFIALVIMPNINIFISIFQKPNENWFHIKEYMLKGYILNSMTLVIFTGLFTVIIGVSLAWIISVYEFPMRSFFKWGLILPLSIPSYIGAYTYNGILNYTGIVQTFLRNSFNMQINQKYFDIMSIKGAVFIFTVSLFPYVYIITRSFLEKQSAALIENARVLGRNLIDIFLLIVMPISRGAIIGGASLVILEVLNDYGVVQYFGIPTFSTAIFKTWFGMGDTDSAIRLSGVLMLIVIIILASEKFLRGNKKFSYTTTKIRPISRIKLDGFKSNLLFGYCFFIFSIGFLIPTIQLIYWSVLTYKKILNIEFLNLIFNSFSVAAISASLVVIMAVVIANYCRINENFISKLYSKATLIGYSIPAAVIAISVIMFFIKIDNNFYWIYKIIDSDSKKMLLSTSLVMLIFAYIIRFLAVGYNSIDSGFEKIGKKFFEASRMLGMSVTQTFFKVDLKMIKPAVLSAFLLVFVDVLKELSLTLILRPFNFNTLPTKVFEYANDEMIPESSIPSLVIIIISFVSIYLFYKIGDKESV
ncbi:ABC transporter permease [Tepidibacter sp. Z1-5]|uniref:ABC transporter permease n=1 Tax=Tepidibacter sp. Z1-5 TaxID=3134138 RepID=UPI0030C35BBE